MSPSKMMRGRIDGLAIDGETLLASPMLLAALVAMDPADREVFVDRVLLTDQWASIEDRLGISRGQRVYRWNRARAVVVAAVNGAAEAA